MPASLPAFAELHCLSNFTFLRGASHAEELVARAAKLGYAALAITDECSLAGIVRAHEAAKEHGLKLIVGTEITLDDGPAGGRLRWTDSAGLFRYKRKRGRITDGLDRKIHIEHRPIQVIGCRALDDGQLFDGGLSKPREQIEREQQFLVVDEQPHPTAGDVRQFRR